MKKLWLVLIAGCTSLLSLYANANVLTQWPLKAAEKRPLKVLIVAYTFPKLSETFVINQVIGLLEKGHDVRVWAKSAEEENKVHESVAAYDLISRTHYGEVPPTDIESYDVAVCQFGPLGNEFLQVKEALHLKTKVVTFFRGFDISQYLHENEGCYDTLLKKSDLVVTNCEFFKKRLLDLGANPEKTIVYYSAIDCNKFSYSARIAHRSKNDIINIVTVGRLVEKKGIEDLVEAAHRVIAKKRKVHLTIIGEGYRAKKNLKKLVLNLGIEDSVTFAGWRTQDEIARYLKEADIFVLASKTAKNKDQDAIPNALKEAMSTGVPVVTTRHGGIPELVKDGVNGYLVDEGNISEIADRIIELADNQELRTIFSINGRRAVEALFDLSVKNAELSKILKKLVFKNGPTNTHHSFNESLNLIQQHIGACYNDIQRKHVAVTQLESDNLQLQKENKNLVSENEIISKQQQEALSKVRDLTAKYQLTISEIAELTRKYQLALSTNEELTLKTQKIDDENNELISKNKKLKSQLYNASIILAG